MDISRTLNPLLVFLVAALTTLALACGTAAEPTATATPVPPAPTATPAPPTPTPAPEPTATPESMSDSMPTLGADSTWEDVLGALFTDEESACVRDAVGEEIYAAMLNQPFLDQSLESNASAVAHCLSQESQVDLYLAAMSGTAGGGISTESLACLKAGLIDTGEDFFADEIQPAVAVVFLNCLSEDELAALAPSSALEPAGEPSETTPLELLRAQAGLDPNVLALFDCLDQNATQRELEAYFNENSQTLPSAAMECFVLHPLAGG